MIYETRWDFIRPFVNNKRVLDIGPAELVGTINQHKLDRWLHRKIGEVTTSLIGLEKSEEQVRILSAMGFNIIQGDAEQFELDQRFDVVVAGELIEHLSNPGRFLDCVNAHLVDAGIILITTPNRYSILNLFKIIRTGKVPTYHKPLAKHVAYYDEDSITSLLSRHGFQNIQIDYCRWVGEPRTGRKEKLMVALASRYRPPLLPVLLATAQK